MPVSVVFDILPISNLVSKLSDEVINTAKAAYDVSCEKQSFNALGKYLEVIHAYLKDLSSKNLPDSSVSRQALDALQLEVKRADALIVKVKKSSKLYNFVFCRTIVRDLQKAVHDIGAALQMLKLASVEIIVELNEHIQHASQQMLASEANLELLGKLEHGLREQRSDRGFANDILLGIARSLGLSQEPQEISRELESFVRDKKKAAERKQLQEEKYLEQVISLLSRADAAYSWNASREKYSERKDRVIKNSSINAFLEPFQSFKCPITKEPMRDPVTIASDKTYEREAIQEWFAEGNVTDPVTKEHLPNKIIRPNRTLLQSIGEWRDNSYVARILNAKKKLESGEQEVALRDLSKLCEESFVNKDWISFEGLVPLVVELLRSHSPELKSMSLATLCLLTKDNEHNQEIVINAGGLRLAAKCLMRSTTLAKAAAVLLVELLKNESGRSKLEEEPAVFLWLVTRRMDQEDMELMETTNLILDQLSDKDKNVIEMAKVNWCGPLVNRFCQGSYGSKLTIASALSELAPDEKSMEVILEGGTLPQLVHMVNSGDLNSKVAALRALQNLSFHAGVKRFIAESGSVPLLLSLLSNRKMLPQLEEPSSAILMNLALNDGMTYLVDGDGMPLQQENLIRKLVGHLKRRASGAVHQHTLNTLLGLARPLSEQQIRKLLREEMGLSLLFTMIDGTQTKLRDSAVHLLSCLSNEGGGVHIASFFSTEGRFGSLVELMKSTLVNRDIQLAVLRILTNLPMDDKALKDSLLTANVVEALIFMISSEDLVVIESALGALLMFTDQSDVDTQLHVAQLEIFPLLNKVLVSGSSVAKIRAATALRDFSSSTPQLSVDLPVKGCFGLKNGSKLCRIHMGKCEAKKTLCILEAKSIPNLVGILKHPDSEVAEAGMEALFTLLVNESTVEKAIEVLHDAEVMKPLLHLLTNGSTECIHKAMKFVEALLRAPKVRARYSQDIRRKLFSLTNGNCSSSLRDHAATVLAGC